MKHSYRYKESLPRGVVIDGLSFLYQLSDNIPWKEGGRYWLLRDKLREFFCCLKSSHIESIVVMDGFDLQKGSSCGKGRYRIKAYNQVIAYWIEHRYNTAELPDDLTIPLLSFRVFFMVTKEQDVSVLFADGEADRDVVAIANYYNYPVLANDSDYYMYDIKAGYMPLTRLDWRARPFKLEVYKLCDFNCQFGLTDPQLSRVIPAVLGNDLIIIGLMDRLIEEGVISIDHNRQVGSLVRFISKVSNVQQLISHIREKMDKGEEIAEALEMNIRIAEEMYDGIKPLSKQDLWTKSLLVPYSGNRGKFPKWLTENNDEGRFLIAIALKGRYLPKCVIDDPHKPTARLASVGIRQSMYTMMSPLMKERSLRVTEIMRNELKKGGKIEDIEMVDHEVILSPSPTLPSVLDIEGMSPDEKLSVFCHVLGIDRNILNGFDKEWKLVIAAACYWVKECRPSEVLVKSLAATFVQCSRIQPSADRSETNKKILYNLRDITRTDQWLDALHSFACFQCIYIDTVTLNYLLALLHGCLDDTLSPAFFFDGRYAITYVCTDKLNYKVGRKIVPDSFYKRIFETLMTFVVGL